MRRQKRQAIKVSLVEKACRMLTSACSKKLAFESVLRLFVHVQHFQSPDAHTKEAGRPLWSLFYHLQKKIVYNPSVVML